MKNQISYEKDEEESKDPKNKKPQYIIKLFDELSDIDISYLEIELLQVIINFKW
jgi:hypothetical protein